MKSGLYFMDFSMGRESRHDHDDGHVHMAADLLAYEYLTFFQNIFSI